MKTRLERPKERAQHMSRRDLSQTQQGFTLLEILIALFIFSILSLILVSALRTVINAQSVTEAKSKRLRESQMALLLLSRELEQAVDRPITDSSGKEEAAFIGTKIGFSFTHMGLANFPGSTGRSALQRTEYIFTENQLLRFTWPILDQAPQTKASQRPLLNAVSSIQFQYLDNEGRFSDDWPVETGSALPKAVRIYLTWAKWGKMSQLYLIPASQSQKTEQVEKN